MPLSDTRAQIILNSERRANDPLRDDQLIGVKERFHPELEPNGLNLHSIIVQPELSVSKEYNSNLTAVNDGADDLILTARPELALRIPTPGYELQISGELTSHRHRRHQAENNIEYSLSANSEVAISSSYIILFKGGKGKFTEPRTAIGAPVDRENPVQFLKSHAGLAFRKIAGRLLIDTQVLAERFKFSNALQHSEIDTAPLTDDRSRHEMRLSTSGEYAFSPDTAIWGIVRANRKSRYREQGRKASGIELAGGLRFKPSPLIEFSGAIGYLEQYFRAPFRDVKGVTVDARIKWLPTMLTTVGMEFSRKIEDRGSRAPEDFFIRKIEVTVDHELRRNFILDFSLGWMEFNLTRDEPENQRFDLAFGAQYRPNRNWILSAKYGRIKQSAFLVERSFTQSRFSLSLAVNI